MNMSYKEAKRYANATVKESLMLTSTLEATIKMAWLEGYYYAQEELKPNIKEQTPCDSQEKTSSSTIAK